MKMLYPKFLKSAMDEAHFPKPGAPEIAFLGRSNVGKSSLINALLGQKQAHVSSTPGRNLLVAGTKADRLSGNGRAKAIAALREAFGAENLLLVSSKTGAGMKELWAAIQGAASSG